MKEVYIIGIVGLFLAACGPSSESQSQIKIETAEMVADDPDKEKPLEEDAGPEVISVRGFIDVPPTHRVEITPVYGGYVTDVRVLPGQKVSKGSVLFVLQNPLFVELQEQYLEAIEGLTFLRLEFERQETLAKDAISAKKNFERVQSEYRAKQARVNGLAEKLKLAGIQPEYIRENGMVSSVAIQSPLNGYVTGVKFNSGSYLDPQSKAMEIVSTNHIHLELEVFEKDAVRVKPGQIIYFTLPEMGHQRYQAVVHLVVPDIDRNKRTFNVHGHIVDDVKTKLIPGAFVNAEIQTTD